jgi:hypothetical protein
MAGGLFYSIQYLLAILIHFQHRIFVGMIPLSIGERFVSNLLEFTVMFGRVVY